MSRYCGLRSEPRFRLTGVVCRQYHYSRGKNRENNFHSHFWPTRFRYTVNSFLCCRTGPFMVLHVHVRRNSVRRVTLGDICFYFIFLLPHHSGFRLFENVRNVLITVKLRNNDISQVSMAIRKGRQSERKRLNVLKLPKRFAKHGFLPNGLFLFNLDVRYSFSFYEFNHNDLI